MVLVAHGHYTVDVLIAYYVTTRLWYIYHTLANNPHLKVRPTFGRFVKISPLAATNCFKPDHSFVSIILAALKCKAILNTRCKQFLHVPLVTYANS